MPKIRALPEFIFPGRDLVQTQGIGSLLSVPLISREVAFHIYGCFGMEPNLGIPKPLEVSQREINLYMQTVTEYWIAFLVLLQHNTGILVSFD